MRDPNEAPRVDGGGGGLCYLDPQKKYCLGTVSEDILLEGLNRFHSAPTSLLAQMWTKTHRCLVCIKDPLLIH